MDRLARRGWGRPHVDPSHMLVGAGATHALFCAARAVLEPGDEVVVLAPYWPLSVGVFQSAGARVVEAPLQAPPNVSGLWPTPEAVTEALTRALSPRSKAVYLISPNNPDGSVWSREALMALAHLAERHDLWVFSDEVYADYIYEGDHHSFGCLPGMEDRTFTLYSFSKSHGLAGARVGLLLGPREAMAGAKKVATHTVFNVPVVAQRAALEATLHGHAWMGHAHDAYRQARQIAMASMVRAGISHVPCRGGTYLFLDLSPVASRTTARGVLEHCIDHGVLLAPGEAFGEAFHGWARLCFTAVGPETLAAALARFEEAMHLLRRKNA
jgi:aspartate/methionine/tyrosine aminotransferase